MSKEKRSVSPVIATVLLVSMVVVIALIVFLWVRGISKEVITKFGGVNVEVVCGDIEMTADYNNDELFISNDGNVPIFGMKVKVEGGGSHETLDLAEISSFSGLDPGATFSSGDIGSEVGNPEKITLIPVLLGSSDKGEKTYVCNEGQHGYEVAIF
jgi:flagellin-like protein